VTAIDYSTRLASVQKRLEAEGIDALLVTNMTNVRYLSGFTGTNGYVLVAGRGVRFLTDGRYRLQAGEQVRHAEVQICQGHQEVIGALEELAKSWKLERVGFEAADVTVVSRRPSWEPPPGMDRIKSCFPLAELVSTTRWVEDLRVIKDPHELELIGTAAEIADDGFKYIVERIKPGVTEKELALDLEFHLRAAGADDISFDPIVAAAERSALPHASPTDRPTERGRFVLFDFGCLVGGYCSDLTRTVLLGPEDEGHVGIYRLVHRAQAKSLAAAGPGAICGDVDRAAREVIAGAGHGDAFPHGLGHGVGMEVHEEPTLKPGYTDQLQPGHVVTIEPGVYLEGWGGVRIEDLVVVTQEGVQTLTNAPKDLIVL
jgi:Xaa-Pro aminopeptidase